jgi:acetyl esterase/lipase
MSKFTRIFLFVLMAGMAASFAHAGSLTSDQLLQRSIITPTKYLAYGSDPQQFGELWLPEGSGPFPVVIMIHGGCWQALPPGLELMTPIADDLRNSGVAVWNIEYRRLSATGGGYPETFMDVADGVDYLRQIADANKLDLSHVTVLGHSAGGHLALWAAARGRLPKSSTLYRANPLPVGEAVSLAGIGDLKQFAEQGDRICGPQTIEKLIDSKTRKYAPYADTSPASLLPLKVPQLIVSGSVDQAVPTPFGTAYAAKAQAAGDAVTKLEIAGAGHVELIDPKNDAWKQIKETLLPLVKPEAKADVGN